MEKKRFHEKVALITGAACGIGAACAKRFVSEGARVVLVDIDDNGALVAQKLGSNAIFVKCDVGERAQVEEVLASLPGAYTAIDIVVNNAAVPANSNFFDLTEDDFSSALKVNVLGAFHFSQLCARQMVQRVRAGESAGAIVNIISINAILAMPRSVAYCASKGGLLQLTRASAIALAPYGIRVNAIGPGSITTESNNEALDSVAARTPLGRLGTSDEVANAVAFLASPEAAYITGETVYIDGGRLVLNYTMR